MQFINTFVLQYRIINNDTWFNKIWNMIEFIEMWIQINIDFNQIF